MEKAFRVVGTFWLYSSPITIPLTLFSGLHTLGKHGFGSAGHESFREATNFSEPWGYEELLVVSGGTLVISSFMFFVMLMSLHEEGQRRQRSSVEADLDEVPTSPRNSDPFEALIRRK